MMSRFAVGLPVVGNREAFSQKRNREFNSLGNTLNNNANIIKSSNQALASNILALKGTIESAEILSNAGNLYDRVLKTEKQSIEGKISSEGMEKYAK